MYLYEKDKWETKNHRILNIKNMGTSHIKNTIKMLDRNRCFYDYCDGDYFEPESFCYVDNSHLVIKKIKELQQELKNRNEEEVKLEYEDIGLSMFDCF